MFCQTLLNISKSGKILIPTFRIGVRCESSGSSCSSDEENNDKNDGLALNSEVESGINDQINKEFTAFYANIAMAEFYIRKTNGYIGLAKDHACHVKGELCQVQKLISILSQRGGNLSLKRIAPPKSKNWKCALDVEVAAMQLEKMTAKGLMDLLNVSSQAQDHLVSHIVTSSLMAEQMKYIFELEQRQAKLELCSSPNCLLLLDNALQNKKK